MSSRKKTVVRRHQRTFLLANLTLVAILAASHPSLLTKVYAAANTYEWTKQVDQDLLGGSYTSVASSANGSHLIVGTSYGGENQSMGSPLFVSSNYGATWENVTDIADSNIRNDWQSVDVSNDGQKMVAASDRSVDSAEFTGDDPGKIFISQDGGDSWSNVSPNITEEWVSIAISGDGSKIVAVADDDQNNVYISDNNGVSWQTSPINENLWHWDSISISDDGEKILFGGENNNNASLLAEISTDGGNSWDNISPNATDISNITRTAMSANGDKIVITNQGWNGENFDKVYESNNDGASWNDITPVDANNNVWSAVALSGDSSKLSVMDDSNKMYLSSDVGASWTEEDPGQADNDTNSWGSIDFSDKGELAIAASSGNAYVSAYTAPQSPTVTLDNAEVGKTIAITTPSGTTITCHSAAKESGVSKQDFAYSYPMGLVDFCFSGADENNAVNLVFVTDLKPQQVVARKFNPTSKQYSTITDAVITQTTYQGQPALQVAYNIVDNGPLDTDPDIGEIADPVGLGVADIAAPATGFGQTKQNNNITTISLLAGITIATGKLTSPVRRKLAKLTRLNK